MHRLLRYATGSKGICSVALVSILVAACGGGSGNSTRTTVTAPPAINLAGSGGDMSKYIGTWTSDCGLKLNIGKVGDAASSGVINTFFLTAASADTVQGTLISRESSFGCTGAYTETTSTITLKYVSNVLATGVSGRTSDFTGSADKVTLGVTGSSANTVFYFGFRENFSKFQLTSLDYFSSTDLVYSRK